MPYAVMQKNSEPISIDQLKAAFRNVPGLTEIDAYNFGRDSFGIIVKDFELDRANALQASLAAENIPAEVVEESALPQLPNTFFLSRLNPTPEALLAYDSLGREASIPWPHIALLAAGKVTMREFIDNPRPSGRGLDAITETVAFAEGHSGIGLNRSIGPEIFVRTHEEKHARFLLEIILIDQTTRYSINADKAPPTLFGYLGPRRTRDLAANFTLLIQDLLPNATTAAVNFGADQFRQNQPFLYSSKTSFYNEMIWLLWNSRK